MIYKLCISLIRASTNLTSFEIWKRCAQFLRVESRIQEFYRIPFTTIGDSYENKKRTGWWTGFKEDRRAEDDGAWQKRSRGEIWPAGRRGQGEKQFDSHNIQPAHRWSVQSCPDSGYIVLACWPDLAKYIALSGRGQLRL